MLLRDQNVGKFYCIYAYTFVATFFSLSYMYSWEFSVANKNNNNNNNNNNKNNKKHLVLMLGKMVYVMYFGEL